MAYIRKPFNTNGQWIVQIVETRSPLAKVTEEFKSSCYASAYKVYQRLMHEFGHVETWDKSTKQNNEKYIMEDAE